MKLRRALTVVLIICLLLSVTYAAIEATHDCHEEDCPICKIIAVLGALLAAVEVSCVIVLLSLCKPVLTSFEKERKTSFITLIEQKVKLSD